MTVENGRKYCPGCKASRPVRYFPSTPMTSDGLALICSGCRRYGVDRLATRKPRKQYVPRPETKQCRACRRYLSIKAFRPSSKAIVTGLSAYCNHCVRTGADTERSTQRREARAATKERARAAAGKTCERCRIWREHEHYAGRDRVCRYCKATDRGLRIDARGELLKRCRRCHLEWAARLFPDGLSICRSCLDAQRVANPLVPLL